MLKKTHRQAIQRRLERVLIAFFILALLSYIVVYAAVPSMYTQLLLIKPAATHRYPLPATLFLIAIVGFISVLLTGVMHHWRWVFWLLLVAFGASILDIPVTILQLVGIIPNPFPVWYSLYRMIITVIEVIIAGWMVHIYRQYGVWAMGRNHIKSIDRVD